MSDLPRIVNEIYKNISNKEETKGFDFSAGANWIYPLNFPIRDYQFNIVKNALFENTLVSLPTGLGKTFIAAVVMYNYFRWYPNGKIIFMAPTRPLVRQQIDACYSIVGIPKETTVELTGTIQQTTRAALWRDKRVFFITPHVLQNDLDSVPEIAEKIKCLVIDEAHKAKGTYAYCEVMHKLQERNKYFRVLALSATPGGNVREILKVAKTLYISHLELKTDESPDVAPYVYKRTIAIVNVPLDKKLYDVREDYLKIIEQYARVLIQNKVFTGNYSQLTKGRIFMTLKDYQARKARNVDIPNYNNIMKSLNICLTLYHGLELLTKHGLRSFLLYYKEHIQKPLLRGNQALHDIINDLNEYLGPLPDLPHFPDGNIPQVPKNIRFGHPKFRKLGDVLSSHFIENDGDSTRVIVFFEYKDSVLEAYALLLEYHPLVRAKVFVGQSFITQKQQKSTLNIFRTGECNTLLSTSIGEEGLDVGEVDLIVCFDINSKSSIRMVQRMGRTGRKREGKVIVLVTEGKEEELFRECLVQKKLLNESILNCSELHTHLYQDNPKMLPDGLEPECKKIHITVRKEEEKPMENKSTKTATKRNKNNVQSNTIKTMFESISSCQGMSNEICSESEYRLPETEMLCLGGENNSINSVNRNIDFSKYLEIQRSWQSRFLVDHSQNSDLLRSVLQFADLKRFNIPQTQIDKTKYAKTGEGLYQSDIRSMFSRQQQIPISQLEVDVNLNEKVAEILFENKQFEASNDLQTEIRDYLTISYSNMFRCEMCDKHRHICNLFQSAIKEYHNFNALSWTQPDNINFDYLNKDTLNKFLKQSRCENNKEDDYFDEDEFISADLFNNIKFQCKEPNDSVTRNLECRKNCTNKINSTTNCNNLMDSFKDDDFFSMHFIEDMLIHSTTDTSKTNNEIKLDVALHNDTSVCEKSITKEAVVKPVVIKLDSKFPCEQSHENSILIDDEFISSDILAQFNFNSSSKGDDNKSTIMETKSPRITPSQKNFQTPTNLLKIKNEHTMNKLKENILNHSDFFAENVLMELSNTSFNFKNIKSPTIGGNASVDKSFERIFEMDKSIVLIDKTSKEQISKNDICTLQINLEKSGNVNCNPTSTEDEFMDSDAILAEMVKDSKNVQKSTENDAGSDDTILNSSASDCEEVGENQVCPLNQAFCDPKSISPYSKSNNKYNTQSSNSIAKLQSHESRNDCASPDLFCDSDPCIPEIDKELLGDSNAGTILFSQKLSEENSNFVFMDSKESPKNLMDNSYEGTILLSPTTPTESSIFMKSPNSPCITLSSDSNEQYPRKFCSDNESIEKSPSLWNLSKIYTQTSKDINGASFNGMLSLSTERIDSLSFTESMFNSLDFPVENFNVITEASNREEKKPKAKRKLSINSSFLDMEAIQDGTQSADEDEIDLNEYDASFVNDASQDVGNSTALHAFYLKTTRSPKKKQKGFKIPALPQMDKMNIFSQIEPTQNDTYLEDSFCVDILTQNITKETEFDVLEEAEEILKNRKRRKRSKNSEDINKKKKRRIRVLSDSD